MEMYLALTTELSLDEALDLDEMDKVARSWREAIEANHQAKRERDAKVSRRRGKR